MSKKHESGSLLRNWRDIRQEGRKRPTTAEARKRRLTRTAKLGSLAMGAGMLVGGVGFGIYFAVTNAAPLHTPASSHALEEVEFQSDGFLGQEWFTETFALSPDTTLMELDLADIKARLEEQPQIREARVERQLPGTLRVFVEERPPLLRARVALSGQVRTLVVARDGTVFMPAGYPQRILRQLPYLGGVRFKREGKFFAGVEGVDTVAELLDTARQQYPELAASWRSIYLDDLRPETPEVQRALRVRSSRHGDIRFRPEGFGEQLARLAEIVNHHKHHPEGEVAGINLTFSTQAVVRYQPE